MVTTTMTTALAGLAPDLLKVCAVGLAISVSIFALKKGWELVVEFNK